MIKRRTPLKTRGLKLHGLASGGLKSGGLKKTGISRSKPTKVGKKVDKNLLLVDQAFYKEIWRKRQHTCEVCKAPLTEELKIIYFDHLLEKSPYPQFRHVEENIALVCMDCHAVKTNGFPRPRHQELIQQAKDLLLWA